MDREQLETTFDKQAPHYDQQWSRMAAFRDSIHLLLASLFSDLPTQASLLCVGAGTGAEIHYLAHRFPEWTFVAVEPSSGMVDAARQRARQHGYAERCTFHHGYLDSLPDTARFDGATSLLVSQFILDEADRSAFFCAIATRLKPAGILAVSDLACDSMLEPDNKLLGLWLRTMASADVPPERLQQILEAYNRDVAILPAARVGQIIASGGFELPVPFFQAGLIHGWFTRRRAH